MDGVVSYYYFRNAHIQCEVLRHIICTSVSIKSDKCKYVLSFKRSYMYASLHLNSNTMDYRQKRRKMSFRSLLTDWDSCSSNTCEQKTETVFHWKKKVFLKTNLITPSKNQIFGTIFFINWCKVMRNLFRIKFSVIKM